MIKPSLAAGAVQGSAASAPGARHAQAKGNCADVAALLERISAGDRTALALFINRYESRIRRRIRGTLSPALMSVFDSQDILSTVRMRLDLLMCSGRLDVTTEQALCALIASLAEHTVKQKARAAGRLRQRELRYCLAKESADRSGSRSSGASVLDVGWIVASLESETDRHILTQWMAGTPLRAIAAQLGLTESTVRKRWQRLKRELRVRLGPDSSARPQRDLQPECSQEDSDAGRPPAPRASAGHVAEAPAGFPRDRRRATPRMGRTPAQETARCSIES